MSGWSTTTAGLILAAAVIIIIIIIICAPYYVQKLLSELEDTEALLNPLEKELQRQVDELDRFMKERSHLEKQLEVC